MRSQFNYPHEMRLAIFVTLTFFGSFCTPVPRAIIKLPTKISKQKDEDEEVENRAEYFHRHLRAVDSLKRTPEWRRRVRASVKRRASVARIEREYQLEIAN